LRVRGYVVGVVRFSSVGMFALGVVLPQPARRRMKQRIRAINVRLFFFDISLTSFLLISIKIALPSIIHVFGG
jgi:hypothetical protein